MMLPLRVAWAVMICVEYPSSAPRVAASSSFVRSKSVVLRVAKGWMPKILSRFQSVFALMCWPGFVEGNPYVSGLSESTGL